MRASRILTAMGLIVAIIVLLRVLNRPSHSHHNHHSHQSYSEDSSSAEESTPPQQTASTTPPPPQVHQQSTLASSQSQPPSEKDLLDVLEKYSGSRSWTFDTDDNGRIFKITGSTLKKVMSDPAVQSSFLKDFQKATGFERPALFQSENQSTASLEIRDQKQLFELPDGSTIPVYEAKLRLVGNKEGDAFIVYDTLESEIDPNIRGELELSPTDAINIAENHLQSKEYELKHTGETYIFTKNRPHQRVSEVIARHGSSTRRLLIGHQTQTVVSDRPTTLH